MFVIFFCKTWWNAPEHVRNSNNVNGIFDCAPSKKELKSQSLFSYLSPYIFETKTNTLRWTMLSITRIGDYKGSERNWDKIQRWLFEKALRELYWEMAVQEKEEISATIALSFKFVYDVPSTKKMYLYIMYYVLFCTSARENVRYICM